MDLSVSKEYYMDEVRDGFFVPSKMKRVWMSELECYQALEEEAAEVGGNCFITFGTLIGAIRGGGFVAWDDDVDTEMIREDMEKLKKRADNHETRGDYVLYDYEDEGNDNVVRKWHDAKSLLLPQEKWGEHYGVPFSTTLDIFPIDCVPRGRKEQELFFDTIVNLIYLSSVSIMLKRRDEGNGYQDRDIDEDEFYKLLSKMEKQLGVKIDRDKNRRPDPIAINRAMDDFCEKSLMDKCDSLISIPYYIRDNGAHRFPKKYYDTVVEMDYEGIRVQVPAGYDDILRSFYGNYMRPVFVFGGHDYPVYRAQEAMLKEQFSIELLHYHYIEDEVAGIKAGRTGKIHLSEKVKNGVQILREAHEYLEQQIVEGEIKDDFTDLLGQCQDFAVSLGTEIENNAVNPEKTVNILEKYCEKIYEVYQRIVSDTDQITMEELSDYISSLREIEDVLTGMSGEIDDKKEIVFITYRPKTWNTLHPLWDVIKKRDDVIVTVIAVPYYYKDFDGNTIKEDMQFNPDDYPDEVETTPYEQYDLELHHPDIIVTQCPYDAYSDAFTIHPYFYTENLYRFTDQLVMIPEFTLREIIDEDERSRIMLRDYVQTPGMVFADRVYVQSEGMRKVYIELLEQFMVDELSGEVAYNLSGTDEADIDKIKKVVDWGEKIRGSGAPVYDWQNKRRNLYKSIEREVCYDDRGEIVTPGGYDHILEVPEEWIKKSSRQDRSRKKVMLCCVSGSVLLTYGMTCLTHMMRAVEIMLEYNEDLVVIYTPDPNVKKILSGNDEVTLDKYISWVEGLVERSDIIVDMSGDAKRVSLFADAYYGDGCVAMNECRMQHKPTLTESPKASLEATKRYEPQTWNADMTVEDEGKWMLRNYIDEVLGYELPSDPTGNSERIAEDLFR